jgi:hypothetical protein
MSDLGEFGIEISGMSSSLRLQALKNRMPTISITVDKVA